MSKYQADKKTTTIIEIDNWPRKEIYNFFKTYEIPYFSLCANLDITEAYQYCKQKNISFSKIIVYLSTRIANNIKEFRYRIKDNAIIEYNIVDPSFTILITSETFNFCTVNYCEDTIEFINRTETKIEELKNKNNLASEPVRDDLIYMTCIPWVSFTSIGHPVRLKNPDSIPRVAWGKYFKENDRLKMPYNIQAHHAIIDGIHLGKFFESIQNYLSNPESIFIKHN
ncbi:MAG: chloramphenicol acetyltransferase [Cyanobacteriota bacterium]